MLVLMWAIISSAAYRGRLTNYGRVLQWNCEWKFQCEIVAGQQLSDFWGYSLEGLKETFCRGQFLEGRSKKAGSGSNKSLKLLQYACSLKRWHFQKAVEVLIQFIVVAQDMVEYSGQIGDLIKVHNSINIVKKCRMSVHSAQRRRQ